MMAYSVFSRYYDALTQNVAYAARCNALCTLLARYGCKPQLVVDLACGTGSLTLELARRGFDPIGVDASSAMLAEAQQKAAQAGRQILFLCQKMQQLDLYGTVDAVFCTLDSINHMTRLADVQETMRRVSLFLNPGGLFIFDVNTLYKHRVVLANRTFVYETDEVFCVWQNALRADGVTVEMQLDFFERHGAAYARSSEHFCERAYADEELCAALQAAGLTLLARCAENTLAAPGPNTERVIYVAQKPITQENGEA